MTPHAARRCWTVGFALLLLTPVALRLSTPERTGFFNEVTIVSGLLATSTMAAAVILPSRIKSLTRAFGLETVMGLHRTMGLLTVALLGLHILAILAEDPDAVWLFAPWAAPPRAVAGTLGVVAVCGLIVLATGRARAKRSYETWRWTHLTLAFGVVVPAAVHIVLLRHLILEPIAGGFLGIVGGVVFSVLVWRWFVRPSDSRGRFVVSAVRRESPTVSTVDLSPTDPGASMRFDPGQFAWLRTERTAFSQEHPFTISSAAQDRTRPSFTIRHNGDWTAANIGQSRPGDVVWIDGPHGGLTPNADATGLVLIAGGVGITPMLSMVRTLARHDDPRPIRLFLADRPGETMFRDELATLRDRLNLDIVETHRAPMTADLLGSALPGGFRRDQLDYFICGSPRLVDDTSGALSELGIPDRRVHTELFDVA